MNLLLLGAGYSAIRATQYLRKQCATVQGTTRSTERFPTLQDAQIEPLLFADGKVSPLLSAAIRRATHIIVSIAPKGAPDFVEPVLSVVDPVLVSDNTRWIGYLSTVGVYGDHQGKWVDENSVCSPLSLRSVNRMAAECAWQQLTQHAGIPLSILRLSGIYGPGRNALVNLHTGKARRMVKPGQVFNRIHVDDIATAISVCAITRTSGIYNITDDCPAPAQDVVTYAAELMQKEPPVETDFDSTDLSPMARSFYSENKRVANAKSKTIPGMKYRYPDYKSGLQSLWHSGDWAGHG